VCLFVVLYCVVRLFCIVVELFVRCCLFPCLFVCWFICIVVGLRLGCFVCFWLFGVCLFSVVCLFVQVFVYPFCVFVFV